MELDAWMALNMEFIGHNLILMMSLSLPIDYLSFGKIFQEDGVIKTAHLNLFNPAIKFKEIKLDQRIGRIHNFS